MDNGYKVWRASYNWRGGRGAFQEYEAVVVAETQGAALGWVLMEYPDTDGKDWEIREIPTDKDGVHRISSRTD